MSKQFIQVGDVEMCYRFVGEGPPLVMIMGFTANMDWWNQDLIDQLSPHHTLLLLDNRGTGSTSSGSRRFTIPRFADDTAMLMAELGIAKAHILGASMGGMIAQEFALNYPGKTDKLVLLCTTCGGAHVTPPHPAVIKEMLKKYPTPEEEARHSIDILYPTDWIVANPEKVQATVESLCLSPTSVKNGRRQALAILGHHTYSRLPRVQSETLVMCGERDVILPPGNSRTIAGRIPTAELRVFEGGGHGFPMQFPDEVSEQVVSFLAR